MTVHHLHEMTWEEAAALKGAIALLPVGATEAHGPHLPLATDVIISEAMVAEAAKELSAAGECVLIAPSLAYTAAGFAEAFAGTISLTPATVTATIVDIARGLKRFGCRCLVLANSHFDPMHMGSLEEAARECNADGILHVIYPDMTRKPWALRLSDEFKSGACHAGQFEGSVVMAARPDLVREEIRKDLPSNPASLSTAIRAGHHSFEEAGGPRAYFGHPAQASVAEGEETIRVMGGILVEAVLGELKV
jgi:creatinine amidohydrolase